MDNKNFLEDHQVENTSDSSFQLETNRVLNAEVQDRVIAKAGSMVASEGDLSFTGKMSPESGITGVIKEMTTSESSPVMEITGDGRAYLADRGKKVQVLLLKKGERVTVNGNDVLAFEESVDYNITTMDSISGMAAGGLVNVDLTGPGMIAITTHGDPIILQPPVKTDPDATVAWTGNLTPKIDINKSLGDIIGQSSDETYQLHFSGEAGNVIVQPLER